MATLVLFASAAAIGPYLVRFDPIQTDLANAFAPPLWSGGTWQYPLGTDQLGRDLLVRVLIAARLSLVVAFVAVILAAITGTLVGMAAGYAHGWRDSVLSRIMDAQLSLPFIITALAVSIALGSSTGGAIFVIATSMWVAFARVVRAETLVIRESDFVALAQVSGISSSKVVIRHVLPNILPSVLVLISMDVGKALLYEASLSFIGLGAQPPDASFGVMIAQGRPHLLTSSWVALVPSAVLAALALSAMLVGDWLRERFDPTLSMVE